VAFSDTVKTTFKPPAQNIIIIIIIIVNRTRSIHTLNKASIQEKFKKNFSADINYGTQIIKLLHKFQRVTTQCKIWERISNTFAYTLCPQKTCDYILYNNFDNNCPTTIIFGTVSSQSMRHREMVSFSTSSMIYLVQLPYLGKSQNTKTTNFAVSNILCCRKCSHVFFRGTQCSNRQTDGRTQHAQ